MSIAQKRVIIIFWRWERFLKSEQDFLKELASTSLSKGQVPLWKDQYFDEFVVGREKNDQFEPDKDVALVVRSKLKNVPTVPQCYDFIELLVKHYHADGSNEVMVFLHRGRKDNYNSQAVEVLKKRLPNIKFFLIGGGLDYIYFKTQQAGLLGEDGLFYYQEESKTQNEIVVADEEEQYIYQPHFNKVWSYYKYEFETKISDLHYDLLFHLTPLMATTTKQSATGLHAKLSPVLLERIHSFMGLRVDQKTMEDAEKESEKSYTFDDLRENLLVEEGEVLKEYEDVVEKLDLYFIKSSDKPFSLANCLQSLHKEFVELVAIVRQKNELNYA